MISIVKRKINMTDELRSKIKWACTFNNCVPKIKDGSLKLIEHTNLAYVEPHRVIIKEKLFLFFKNPIDENLKDTDPLKWTGLMNNYKYSAEEIIYLELIYC